MIWRQRASLRTRHRGCVHGVERRPTNSGSRASPSTQMPPRSFACPTALPGGSPCTMHVKEFRRMRHHNTRALFALALLAISCKGAGETGTQIDRAHGTEFLPKAPKPAATIQGTATIQGSTVKLEPWNATFKIPLRWIERHAEHKYNNLHLTRAELEKVRVGDGEW